jgi:hypothetical protein
MKVTTVKLADGTYDYKLDGVRGGVSTLTPWGARYQGQQMAAKLAAAPKPDMRTLTIDERDALGEAPRVDRSYGNYGTKKVARQRVIGEIAEARGIAVADVHKLIRQRFGVANDGNVWAVTLVVNGWLVRPQLHLGLFTEAEAREFADNLNAGRAMAYSQNGMRL